MSTAEAEDAQGEARAERQELATGCDPQVDPEWRGTTVRCRSYPVTGSTLAEIAGQLARVVDPTDNARVAAVTRWFVRWRYAYAPSAPGCAISSPRVSLRLAFVVPRWRPAGEVDGAVVQAWNRFYAALWRHEQGHVQNGLDAANAVRRKLVRLGTFPTCEELETRADAATARILRRHKAKDRAYDLTTEHGATQGAVLAP